MAGVLESILRMANERAARLPREFDMPERERRSLAASIRTSRSGNAIIGELKFRSPVGGSLRTGGAPEMIARGMEIGGACGISVLTEPHFFGGSPEIVSRVRRSVQLPVLRKDFIVDRRQVKETAALGADAILLIAKVLRGDLESFVELSLQYGLEPLVEVNTLEEAEHSLSSGAMLIGINNRDLSTMRVDLGTTLRLAPLLRGDGRIVVSMSGLSSGEDVRRMKGLCDAFLVGTALMSSEDPGRKMEEFVCA